MVREFSRNFNGQCCEEDFGECNWTCREIEERINSRAPVGSVYTRGQMDTLLQSLRAQLATAVATNSVIIDLEANLPAADPSNAGYIYLTTDDPYKLFISDGFTWILVVDEAAFTATSPATGDMEKATYDIGDDGFIDVAAGGTGADFSASTGFVAIESGVSETTRNKLYSQRRLIGSDTLLNTTDPSVQIFDITTDREVYVPSSPLDETYFRIINTSLTNSLTIRDGIAGPILIVLETSDVRCADFHFNDSDWFVIKQEIV